METTNAKTPLLFNPEGIPDELKRGDQRFIITWCAEIKPQTSKISKTPGHRNDHGRVIPISIAKPENLLTFDEAISSVQAGRADGIGLALHSSTQTPYGAIDVDDPSDAFAQEIIAEARRRGCYIQRSPSGRGLHIIGRGLNKATAGKEQAIDLPGTYITLTGVMAEDDERWHDGVVGLGDPNIEIQNMLDEIYLHYHSGASTTGDNTRDVRNIPPRPDFADVWSKLRTETQGQMEQGYPALSGDASAVARKAAIELRIEGLEVPEIACVLSEPGLAVSEKALRNRNGNVDSAYQWAYTYQALTVVSDKVCAGDCFQEFIDTDSTPVKPRDPYIGLFADAHDLIRRDMTINYLIDGLIETSTTGLFFGDSTAGKSFVAIDMALAVAFGTSWMGAKARRGSVLYFNGEGHGGIPRRIKAWLRHYGYDDIPKGQFTVTQRRIEITEQSVMKLEPHIKAITSKYGPIVVMYIDTLAKHISSAADENSAKDIGGYLNAVDYLRDKYQCTVATIHHSGKGNKETSRGSSAIRGALDWEVKVARNEITFTKMKEEELPPPFGFSLEKAGDSAVPVRCHYDPTHGKAPNLPGDARQLLSILQMGISETGKNLTRSDLCDRFYIAMGDRVKPTTKNKKFNRAEDALLKVGLMRIEGEYVRDNTLSAIEIAEGHARDT